MSWKPGVQAIRLEIIALSTRGLPKRICEPTTWHNQGNLFRKSLGQSHRNALDAHRTNQGYPRSCRIHCQIVPRRKVRFRAISATEAIRGLRFKAISATRCFSFFLLYPRLAKTKKTKQTIATTLKRKSKRKQTSPTLKI